jgi:hypothetical protein
MFAKAAITGTLQAGGPTFTAEYLVVAGGGGGGRGDTNNNGGGGGAGGYRSSVTGESSGGGASAESALGIALGTPYTVTVGAGGAGGASVYTLGVNGNDSVLSTVTSVGGGGGGAVNGSPAPDFGRGKDGGSGGGSGDFNSNNPGGSGTANQGFDGGSGIGAAGVSRNMGGGGGAGSVGESYVTQGGGIGLSSLVTGASITRAAGGNGSSSGGSASANTGSGGNGNRNSAAGAGGSGVVIIRVPSEVVAEFSAGVVYNYIPQDDFNVYEITAAGVSDTVTFSQGALATIEDSLRFNDDDSARLTRTPSVAGDRKTWTWSAWVKRGNLSTGAGYYGTLFGALGGSTETIIEYDQDNKIEVRWYSGGYALQVRSSAIYRDSSAWYHIAVAIDTTQATASNRAKLYVNGKQVTALTVATYPAQNSDMDVNNTVGHGIGMRADAIRPFDGYMADVYFIDGEALDPSRFGKQDADGVWQPISYTGTYGTNGFHLDFADNSTAAALGTDVSGNGNDWTPSGITTDDQVSDTPTVNYATWNPLDKGANFTLSDGNLRIDYGTAAWSALRGNFGIPSGQWYWEVYSPGTYVMAGIATKNASLANYIGSDANGYSYYSINGEKNYNGSGTAYGDTWTVSSIIGIAFDSENGTLEFFNDGVSQGVAFTGVTPAEYFPAVSHYAQSWVVANFGQRPFAYTPPAGFVALNSANLPAPVIADGKEHFQPVLYTGNGTSQTVRGLEFGPDFVWIKNRSAGDNHKLLDAVRGATKELESNTTDAEVTNSDGLTAFNSNGFTVGADLEYNTSGENFVAWNWNAGGSTVTNTDGSITSQVRANTDAGISIVSYVGNGTDNATVGHGLGVAPGLIISKNRDTTSNWTTWHGTFAANDYIALNLTSAKNYAGALTNVFGGTDGSAPSSTVVKFGTDLGVNGSGQDIVLYCFAEVDGFSKFGSYTGNGSADGPFVYTGFRPAFVMFKRTDAASQWGIFDSKRNVSNVAVNLLYPNNTSAETTNAGRDMDILSNGFKLRGIANDSNASGGTIIYMAFAENPFKTARAR